MPGIVSSGSQALTHLDLKSVYEDSERRLRIRTPENGSHLPNVTMLIPGRGEGEPRLQSLALNHSCKGGRQIHLKGRKLVGKVSNVL